MALFFTAPYPSSHIHPRSPGLLRELTLPLTSIRILSPFAPEPPDPARPPALFFLAPSHRIIPIHVLPVYLSHSRFQSPRLTRIIAIGKPRLSASNARNREISRAEFLPCVSSPLVSPLVRTVTRRDAHVVASLFPSVPSSRLPPLRTVTRQKRPRVSAIITPCVFSSPRNFGYPPP